MLLAVTDRTAISYTACKQAQSEGPSPMRNHNEESNLDTLVGNERIGSPDNKVIKQSQEILPIKRRKRCSKNEQVKDVRYSHTFFQVSVHLC